jgi:Homeodomain-like domain
VYPASTRDAALALMAAGENDCEVARRLGVPRTTVRDWRRRPSPAPSDLCPRCWRRGSRITFTAEDYAELLGLYLGDGHITALARTDRLRLSLDARYPGIAGETEALLRRCFPSNRVGRLAADRGATVVLWVYSRHLSCLFPQHGPGKKHERPIVLEPWQQQLVEAAPWAFLRGCIRSDGCVFVNRTGRYEYLTYHFGNHSADIRNLFIATCHCVGVHCSVSGRHVRVNRRDSVERLAQHVGTKR